MAAREGGQSSVTRGCARVDTPPGTRSVMLQATGACAAQTHSGTVAAGAGVGRVCVCGGGGGGGGGVASSTFLTTK